MMRVLLWVLCGLLAACAREPLHSQEAFVFGTRVEVQVYGAPNDHAREAVGAVLREFDRLHAAFHAWRPSPLTALNAAIARGERDIALDPEQETLIVEAQKIAAASDALFNPALGKLIAAWGFHGDAFKPVLPTQSSLEKLRAAKPDMADLVIVDHRLTSKNPAVQLDFGGFAKGHALDRAAAIFRAAGIDNALINIGGNILALGKKGGQPWRVGIANPRGTGALATLALHDGEAIGTSGDYQRYFEIDGKRYCHLIDPRSGHPADSAQAVTVVIPPGPHAGAASDATSKPLFIAGDAQWRAYAKRLEVAAALRIDAAGRVSVTREMAARLTAAPGLRFEVVD